MSRNENMSSILYLGFAVPDRIQNEIDTYDAHPHFSIKNFSWSFVRALKHSFDKVIIVSSAEIRNYPAAKKFFFKSESFNYNGFCGHFIGFINVIFFKHITRLVLLLINGTKMAGNYRSRNLIVHGTHTPFMIYAIWLKYIHNYRISILLTDEHGLEVQSDGHLGRILRKIDTYFMQYLLKKFDSFVCLSDIFAIRFNLQNFFVLPGILNSEFNNLIMSGSRIVRFEMFTIVFAGGINKYNGVDNLLKAISKIHLNNIRVVFLGKGDLVEEVRIASTTDKRIAYGGIKDGVDLTDYLCNADLLINPRPVDHEYTRTSFPSKLIEYMATGVPTLTTRLECIPTSLKDCFLYIDFPEPAEIAKSVTGVVNMDPILRKSIGLKAKYEVNKQYSEDVVGKKLFDFINTNQFI